MLDYILYYVVFYCDVLYESVLPFYCIVLHFIVMFCMNPCSDMRQARQQVRPPGCAICCVALQHVILH